MDEDRGRSAPGVNDEPVALGWPLVERRRRQDGPPTKRERREDEDDLTAAPDDTFGAPPLVWFRWGALAIAAIQGRDQLGDGDRNVLVAGALLVAYTIVRSVRPVEYRDRPSERWAAAFDLAVSTAAVCATGASASPFAATLVPSALLVGFVGGVGFAIALTAAAGAAIALATLGLDDAHRKVGDGALWFALVATAAVTSGLTRRGAVRAAGRQSRAIARMSQLAEANALLFSLQRVTQTLPASLDLDVVLDATVARVHSMIDSDVVTVYLYSEGESAYQPVRGRGSARGALLGPDALPLPLRRAMTTTGAVLLTDLSRDGPGVAEEASSGLYAGVRARGSLVGLIAVESRAGALGERDAQLLTGVVEPFGVAIDNAHLFRRLRSRGADEERTRIARDLHDRIGSSLALLGFELDRVVMLVERGDAPLPHLTELREQVRRAVSDVRETLYDLRTEVDPDHDLVTTLRNFMERVRLRSGLVTEFEPVVTGRMGLLQERELWHIAREAVTNVEKHAEATTVTVRFRTDGEAALLRVTDDGKGLPTGSRPPGSYGLVGMRERAAVIGAEVRLSPAPGGGTEVLVSLGLDGFDPTELARSSHGAPAADQ